MCSRCRARPHGMWPCWHGSAPGRWQSARRLTSTPSTPWSCRAASRRRCRCCSSRRACSPAVAERLADGMPAFGTCAGMILLGREILDGRPDQRCFGAIDIGVRRNAFGRQVDSFEADLASTASTTRRSTPCSSGRPVVEPVGDDVDVLATVDGRPGPVPPGPRARGGVPSRARRRPPAPRAVPRRGGLIDVWAFQVGDDQAQEGRQRQGPRQAVRQGAAPGRGGGARGRGRPRHEPDAAHHVPEGPRRARSPSTPSSGRSSGARASSTASPTSRSPTRATPPAASP